MVLVFFNLLRNEFDEAREERSLFSHFPNNWGAQGPGIWPSSSMCHKQWKLIYYYEDQWFDLATDIRERANLADNYPQIRSRLTSLLRDHLKKVDAQFPIDKLTGKALKIPLKVARL